MLQVCNIQCTSFHVHCRYCNGSHTTDLSDYERDRISTYLPNKFQSYMICAGYELGGGGSCKGDSGSPIFVLEARTDIVHYKQIGIVSGGIGECGSPKFPGVYTYLEDESVYQFVMNSIERGNMNLCCTESFVNNNSFRVCTCSSCRTSHKSTPSV